MIYWLQFAKLGNIYPVYCVLVQALGERRNLSHGYSIIAQYSVCVCVACSHSKALRFPGSRAFLR